MIKIKSSFCSDIVKFSKSTGFFIKAKIFNDYLINSYTSLSNLQNNSIVFCKNEDSLNNLDFIKKFNVLVICTNSNKLDDLKINYIETNRPRDLFFTIVDNFLFKDKKIGISSNSTVITENIGKNVFIGEFCYINNFVNIGNNVTIYDNVSILCPCVIGDNTVIFSGTRIGGDGFGMYKDVKGINHQIPHLGGVKIGNNVVIGCNTCIDRGTIDDTIIEDNVKIDNLCHIAHNVYIGKNSLIIAGSILCGSCNVNENSYFAPGAIAMNGITIGENSLVGLGAVVTKSIPANQVVAGVPAKFLRDNN